MKKLSSLKDLYIEELKDLYSAEKQITQALPRMAKKADSEELRMAFEQHLKETEGQMQRLEKIFEELGEKPGGHKCKAMEGLIEEAKEMMAEEAEPSVMDAALIASAQRVEHYEIAGYGCVRTYARMLGFGNAEKLLQQTLEEESQTDEKLTKLAESSININAEQGETASAGSKSK